MASQKRRRATFGEDVELGEEEEDLNLSNNESSDDEPLQQHRMRAVV
jgi:hypothetical protein